MKLLPTDTVPEGPEWLYELKWDGYRCQALRHGNNVRLFSRNGNDFTDRFPEIADAVLRVRCESALIDGEIVALDANGRPYFQKLIDGSRDDCALFFFAFDLLHLDGRSMLRRPLEERKAELARRLLGTGVRFSDSLNTTPERLMAEVSKLQLEGVVAKRRTSLYEAGRRSGSWLKWKALKHDEFVVGGYRPSERSFDCVLVGEYTADGLMFVGRVQAGFPKGSRGKLAKAMGEFAAECCPLVNLPWRTRGRWQEGITAEDMKGYCWLRPGLRLRIGFMEREKTRLLRHPRALALTGWTKVQS